MAFLKHQEVTLYFEQSGSGDPVLFIQGVGVAGEGWRPQVRTLSTEFSTLIFDNRGLGQSTGASGVLRVESMAADALALMDAAGWESAHVVGHSMGGVIAQQVAVEAPRRVRSLSLLCTFPRGKDAARLTPWVLWMTLRTRLGPQARRRRAFLEMLYPSAFLEQSNGVELAAEVAALVGRDLADSPPILWQQVQALGRHDISNRLAELRGLNTWVASAEHDPIAPPCFGRRLAELIPGARFEVIPDASHGVTLQRADWINEQLKRHFKKAASAD